MVVTNAEIIFKWRAFPLLDFPKKSGGILFVIVLFVVGVYITTNNIMWSLISILLFLSSLHNVFFPTYYLLNNNEIVVTHLGIKKKYTWDYFKRYHKIDTGLFLSPFLKNSRLDSFRGIYIYNNNYVEKEKIEEFIKSKLT